MGQVTDYLISLIKNRAKDKGIIVWYDPERVYEKGLSGFDFGSMPVYRYDGSYFRLRRDIESLLSGTDPHKCIVFVPEERKRGASPLIEAESAGQIMEPGAVTGANTRIEVIARAALSEILTADNVEEICKSVAKGSLTLEELDTIAEQGREPGKGVIPLIFNTGNTQEIALKFLFSDEFNDVIVAKNGLSEFTMLLKVAFGFETTSSDPLSIRRSLSRYVLLSEFLACIRNDTIHKIFEQAPKAQKPGHIEACSDLVGVWRNRLDLRESYEKQAIEVEKTFGILKLDISLEDVSGCITFPCTEVWLRQLACNWILGDELARANELITRRKASFWSIMEPLGLIQWNLLETTANLIQKADEIKNILNKKTLKLSELIGRYINIIDEPSGWYMLDYYHRLLEKQYVHYDEGSVDRDDGLIHRIVTKARANYMEVAGLLSESFLDQMAKERSPWKSLPHQQHIYRDYVSEKASREKTVYILVDALRYEMGKELFDALREFQDIRLSYAIAAVPTVTTVGMAALMPGAEDGMTLNVGDDFYPQIGDNILKERKNRIDWLKENTEKEILDLKLEDIIKPKKKTKDAIQKADLIVVTSQEIDAICESDNINLARKVMNDVLGELVRGIRNLSRLGVINFIITADHGYIFGEELDDAMKIDPPGGQTLALHRRFWAGRGGKQEESFVRLSASKLGIGKDFDLAFPKGIGGFKVKGGARAYFHGGMSLQELIVPIITAVGAELTVIAAGDNVYEMYLERKTVTTRFFTIRIKYGSAELFGKEKQRVRIVIKAGNQEIGIVATAVYGHEAGTSELILEKERENHVTIMLREGIKENTITIMLIDSDSGRELKKIEGIPLALTF